MGNRKSFLIMAAPGIDCLDTVKQIVGQANYATFRSIEAYFNDRFSEDDHFLFFPSLECLTNAHHQNFITKLAQLPDAIINNKKHPMPGIITRCFEQVVDELPECFKNDQWEVIQLPETNN